MILRLLFALIAVLSTSTFATVNAAGATANPKEAEQDPDFKVQGEYAGKEFGMQVVALGSGKYQVAIYDGGLPGTGAKANQAKRQSADAQAITEMARSMKLQRVERESPTLGATPPTGATILFDGTQSSIDKHWDNGRLSEDGLLMQGTTSKDRFQSYTLHLEFRTPWMPEAHGQGRGNSGVYHQGRFETQVLDSFGLTGEMNEAGGIYSIKDPDWNLCYPPLRWQTYDVDFTAAKYESGKKIADARMTVRLNGVLVQDDVALPKHTTASMLKEGPEPGPIDLQEHGRLSATETFGWLKSKRVVTALLTEAGKLSQIFATGTRDHRFNLFGSQPRPDGINRAVAHQKEDRISGTVICDRCLQFLQRDVVR